ncbi:MAG: phosphoribosyltransferase [Candidatus Doudnabacteria bacterium]|nr:phosphoribosyltransferase [Candidatus Doudnabacteria bacterium]
MDNKVIEILEKVGALITNSHIVGTSGRHMLAYINKDAIFPHTEQASEIGRLFAEKYKDQDIDVVVGPAVGGTILSQWTAYHLSKLKNKEILSTYTEKDKGTTASAAESEQVFRRGYDSYVKNKKVLVLEDLTTTGTSVKKLIDTVKKAGGTVKAVCVMINRDPKLVNSETMGAPFDSLGVLEIPSYEEKDCPLCKSRVPINTSVGHGKKYLEEKNARNR